LYHNQKQTIMKDQLQKLQDYANSSNNLWLANEMEILCVEIEEAILEAEIKILYKALKEKRRYESK